MALQRLSCSYCACFLLPTVEYRAKVGYLYNLFSSSSSSSGGGSISISSSSGGGGGGSSSSVIIIIISSSMDTQTTPYGK